MSKTRKFRLMALFFFVCAIAAIVVAIVSDAGFKAAIVPIVFALLGAATLTGARQRQS